MRDHDALLSTGPSASVPACRGSDAPEPKKTSKEKGLPPQVNYDPRSATFAEPCPDVVVGNEVEELLGVDGRLEYAVRVFVTGAEW